LTLALDADRCGARPVQWAEGTARASTSPWPAGPKSGRWRPARNVPRTARPRPARAAPRLGQRRPRATLTKIGGEPGVRRASLAVDLAQVNLAMDRARLRRAVAALVGGRLSTSMRTPGAEVGRGRSRSFGQVTWSAAVGRRCSPSLALLYLSAVQPAARLIPCRTPQCQTN
jgi:hypothetical protein